MARRIAGGPWLTILPRNLLRHSSSAKFQRLVDTLVEDSAGAIAALALSRRCLRGPVRACLDALRQAAPGMPGVAPIG
ncbi:hypothetical protein [Roseomonas fluvialis]|uniref:Uncharacterized protein n=1 Tax=Roseomonas fluvialis TaxID=1750527 RepID=A0ABM8I5I7_9PROT|nr:hypothetical protein [Roseomonas fluvialis]BDG71515.1 hypothetical protein Rmf_14440 [Roseomonas fluvialis]